MKKKFDEISWKVDEKTYRADKAYSYSTLSKFNREGFNNLKSLYDPVSGPYLNFGSAVDTLITDSEETFKKTFYVEKPYKIVPSHKPIIEYLYQHFGTIYKTLESISDALLLEAINFYSFQATRKPGTRIDAIRKDGNEYYQSLCMAENKTIISQEDFDDAYKCVYKLKHSENTHKFFEENSEFDDVQRYYQLKFKGSYKGIPLRCMADEILVDYKNKIVVPVDLKTSSKPEWDFCTSFTHWGYYIQAQLYWYLIRQNMDKDPYFKDFKLLDYVFIVISRKTQIPLLWNYSDTQKTENLVYGKTKNICKNWRNIVQELATYEQEHLKVPLNINLRTANSIVDWLDKDIVDDLQKNK